MYPWHRKKGATVMRRCRNNACKKVFHDLTPMGPLGLCTECINFVDGCEPVIVAKCGLTEARERVLAQMEAAYARACAK